jgi:hypothetical protein
MACFDSMKLKTKLFLAFIFLAVLFIVLFISSPRTVSWIFSYKKHCKVLRVEAFSKGTIITNFQQANKFSVICDDGFICRSDDTGFAGIKVGDEIEYRGFPELGTLEEFGKCDHAQLLKFKAQ